MADKDPFAAYVDTTEADPFAAYVEQPARPPAPRFGLSPLALMFSPEQIAKALPEGFGMAGQFAPGPWSIPASAALGSLGEATGQAMLGQSLDPRRIGAAGMEQGKAATLGLGLGFGAGLAGKGLMKLRGVARGRAVRQAVGESDKATMAKRQAKAGELQRRIPAASQARSEAAAATKAAVAATPGEVTIKDVAERIIAAREQRAGVQVSKNVRQQIVNDVRRRFAVVLPKYSGRVLKGSSTVFDLPTAQFAKQSFDDLVRAAHTGKEGGVRPRPGDDLDIANALRELMEERVPEIAGLNKTTQAALRRESSLKRMQRGTPDPEAAAVRDAERRAGVEAKVLAGRSANPLRMFSGIPVRGGMATPGISFRPGTLSEFGGVIGQGLASQGAQRGFQSSPQALALLAALMQPPNDPFSQFYAPPDALTP